MSILEHILKREANSTVWDSCTLDFSHEVLAQIIDVLLTNTRWAVEGQPGVLWVVIAVRDILIPSEVQGLVILVILNLWALWSALANAWCAINMSIEAHNSVASGSIENINSYIVTIIITAGAAVMRVMVIVNVVVDLNWCCIGVYVHWFWSVWLDIFVLVSDWVVDTLTTVRCFVVARCRGRRVVA